MDIVDQNSMNTKIPHKVFNFNSIQDRPFFSHISNNDETQLSYTLPKEDQKNIYIT